MFSNDGYMKYHECQTCGDPLRLIHPSEREDMAYNPYNYVFFCARHQSDATEEAYR